MKMIASFGLLFSLFFSISILLVLKDERGQYLYGLGFILGMIATFFAFISFIPTRSDV